MALFRSMFNFGKDPEKAVLRILRRMHRLGLPILVEIEGTNYRFNTFLKIIGGTVVVAKPTRLVADVKQGTWIRFEVQGAGEQAIRMEVKNPHYVLLNGNPTILCDIPSQFAPKPERQAKRFNTIRYKNLHLVTEAHAPRFRITDLSAIGCRIVLPDLWPRRKAAAIGGRSRPGRNAVELPGEHKPVAEGFGIGEPLPGGLVLAGSKVELQLSRLVPRVHLIAYGKLMVGLEWVVAPFGDAQKLLHHLIDELQKQEDARIQRQRILR